MDKRKLIRNIFTNKKNNQNSITLPKGMFPKDSLKPKKIKIKDWEFEW